MTPAESGLSGATPPHGLVAALDKLLADGPYRLSALGGSSGRTFLASGPAREVVVRLDADVAVLRLVAEIGAGPPVIDAGSVDARPFVVQGRVRAARADGPWFAEHTAALAALVVRYQSDPRLAALAARGGELDVRSYAGSIASGAEALPADLASVAVPIATGLVDMASGLAAAPSVATHGDPNSSNILAGEPPLLVDWDDLRLADPMRDIGQLAWWYLPEAAWPGFLEATGQALAEPALDRLYWWVAAESLDIGLRLLPEGRVVARSFFADGAAALGRQPNPRRAA